MSAVPITTSIVIVVSARQAVAVETPAGAGRATIMGRPSPFSCRLVTVVVKEALVQPLSTVRVRFGASQTACTTAQRPSVVRQTIAFSRPSENDIASIYVAVAIPPAVRRWRVGTTRI